MNILRIIEKYNLSVRKIPMIIVSIYEPRHYIEGDEFFEHNGKTFIRRITVPENAGMYMVQQVNSTFSTIRWDTKKHYLARSLKKSITLFLNDNLKK